MKDMRFYKDERFGVRIAYVVEQTQRFVKLDNHSRLFPWISKKYLYRTQKEAENGSPAKFYGQFEIEQAEKSERSISAYFNVVPKGWQG